VNLVSGQLYTPIDFLNSPDNYTGKSWTGTYNMSGFYVHPDEALIFLSYQHSLVDFATFLHSNTGKIAIFTSVDIRNLELLVEYS